MDDDHDNTAFSSLTVPLAQLLSAKVVWLFRAFFAINLLISIAFAYLYVQSSRLATLETDVEQLQAEALRLHKQAVVNRFESIENPSKISIVFRQRLLQLSNHGVSGELQVELNRLMLQGSQYAEQLDVALMSHDAFSNIASTLINAQQENTHPKLEVLYQQLTLDLLSLLSQEKINADTTLESLNRSLLTIDTQQQQLRPELQAQAQFVIKSILPMLSRYVQYLQAVQNIHLTPFDDTYNNVLLHVKTVRGQYEKGQLVLFSILVVLITLTTLLPSFFRYLPHKVGAISPSEPLKESNTTDNEITKPTHHLQQAEEALNRGSDQATHTTTTRPIGNMSHQQDGSSLQEQDKTPVDSQPRATRPIVSHHDAASVEIAANPSAPSRFTSLELFDFKHIFHCMDEDLDSVIMLLEIFVQEHSHDDVLFKNALEQGRIEDAARIIHSLKGVAGSIGSNALKSISERLELAIKQEDMIVESDSLELGTILNDVVKTVQDYLETQGVTVEIKKYEAGTSTQAEGGETLMPDDAIKEELQSAQKPVLQPEPVLSSESEQSSKSSNSQTNIHALIDIKYMMTSMDDDIESVKMLLEIFVEEHANDGKKLLQQVHGAAEISEDAIRIVHSIKGVSSSLGAHSLKILAGDIEAKFKQGHPVSDADYRAFDLRLTETISAATYYLEAENLAVYEEGVA
ncbi:Hpt domain-containing protein [Photobacterium swingsii]|uniref:Hpt domain-containing protein n=1 Tax=Photobacterium swingsii TaxID=680026 RepID=UPI0040697BC5